MAARYEKHHPNHTHTDLTAATLRSATMVTSTIFFSRKQAQAIFRHTIPPSMPTDVPAAAFVVRAAATRWLEVQPTDVAAAIQLGYCSGDMHWRVTVSGPVLRIALSGPKEEYLARLAPLIAAGRLKEVSHG